MGGEDGERGYEVGTKCGEEGKEEEGKEAVVCGSSGFVDVLEGTFLEGVCLAVWVRCLKFLMKEEVGDEWGLPGESGRMV